MEDNKLQQDPISRLYNNVKNDYDLPDFNTFKADMSDSKKLNRLHSTLVKDGYEMPSFDVFSVDMGLKKKDGGIVSSPTELPLQGFNQKQIDLLKKGVEKPIQSVSQKKSSGLVVPTNLPKQEALAYENELKLNDVAVNTLTDIYKNKGLKFDPSRPAAKKQIQEYVDKSINGDLTKVTGKDGKEYLVRSQGFLESAGDSFVRSLKDPIESTEINFTDSPEELANLLDEKIRREPNIPEAAPSAVSGYLGGLAGGLPKLAAIAAIPYVGQTAMVGEMYYNALANQRRELYQRGLEEGMDRVSAAKKAMEIAPVSAIPDALVAAVMAKGVGGKATSGVIPNAAKESFIKAAGSALKSIGIVSATGGFAGYERSKIQQRAGYKVTDAEAIENGLREAGDYAIMDAAFKVAHIGPKYLSSAAKNVLSTVPKEVLNVVAEKYPDGQRTLDEIPKFVETKAKVQDFVPEEKIASVAGLTEKTDNIKSEIKDLEEKKKAVTPAIAKEIDLEISEKNKEVDFYDNQIKKVIKSKDQTGISEEIDDATGLKAGEEIITKIEKPSIEQQAKESIEGDLVTFTYKSEAEVPEVFKERISSSGENALPDGTIEKFVRVTIPKSLAEYELNKAKVKPEKATITEEVTPTGIKIGDTVQWTSQGSDQFAEPRKIKSISEDGEYAFVEGSDTGIPIKELSVTEVAPTEVKITEEVKPTEVVEPIRQLGTGANVYFENNKYRVNDNSKGKFLLNIQGKEEGGMSIANIEFDSSKEAVEVAKELSKIYPSGVPDAVLIDKVVDNIRNKIKVKPTELKSESGKVYRVVDNLGEVTGNDRSFSKGLDWYEGDGFLVEANESDVVGKKIPHHKGSLRGMFNNPTKVYYEPEAFVDKKYVIDEINKFKEKYPDVEFVRIEREEGKNGDMITRIVPHGDFDYLFKPTEVKAKEEKTFAQKDLDRAEAKRIHGRVAEMEPPNDAEQVALRYLAEGGKVSQDAINEVSGTTKRASLNTGRRELKTAEAKARDYAGGTESLDDLAHRLWEASGQEISERDIKDALMSEIGNNNTRLDASKAYLERYNIEYQQDKYYERFIEEREEEHAKVNEELERDLRKPLEEEIEGMSSEEHINNLIKQYEAETKRENKQLGPEGEGEAVEEISSRDTGKKAQEKAELAKEYKEAVSKASKKAKENAKKEFVDRNFDNIVEKLKIQIKCPT